ncbi:alpha-glucuronidase family glycosyl hydrolase [Siphonobacter curvatus]|uniref:Xylan alpha-1,2-glucuronidase n=1 Tax=Siphonobacter curvatus TaxID=2094562 RepID=A0A2S7IJM0_9BACT|nr:alpha-glucuronidase family glycosyl hydrolase [Siphonobacter curvatus]PQA56792.1 alpha-glucuronidase [Siphonobacter curvatus]
MKRLLFLYLLLLAPLAKGDDGYQLWLKYDRISNASLRTSYTRSMQFIATEGSSPILNTATDELRQGLKGLLGQSIPSVKASGNRTGGILLRVTPMGADVKDLTPEGYRIVKRQDNLQIISQTDAGVLYGVFALLRQLQMNRPLDSLAVVSRPKVKFRMLNHWDNPNATIERGYAGESMWKWYELPETISPRYRDYARANASIGINGTVLNNVNASPRLLTGEYLKKVAALADVLRPYGIKVYLSVNFAAPKILGGLKTSDPLDPQVRQWWFNKVKEIYQTIPDFGGFLVKANSEGEPGPQDYDRTHADGANMLDEAMKTYPGVVIWRAFVYKADPNADRFKAAFEEFVPFDGKFGSKVIVQVKNGPIDFQPREPFSPIFGRMPRTPLGMEFQLTQEYLGFATHLVYEAPLFKECLDADTYVSGKGSTVAKVIDGSLHGYERTLMAGVANTGSDRNWTGHPLAQANWYAFGRLAWDHSLTSEQIAEEWIRMSLTREPKAVRRIRHMLLRSRDIYVNYNAPMGLSRPWAGVHFAPEPWQNKSPRPDWTAVYYHRADSIGLGFNRTATGSNALSQYHPEVQKGWADAETCPLPYLLWFHHVPWDKPLSSGRNLWDELCTHFYTGADSVQWLQREWAQVKPAVDPVLHADVAGRLRTQYEEAIWWRDAWVLYLQEYAQRPIPAPFQKPKRTLVDVKESVNVYLLR